MRKFEVIIMFLWNVLFYFGEKNVFRTEHNIFKSNPVDLRKMKYIFLILDE